MFEAFSSKIKGLLSKGENGNRKNEAEAKIEADKKKQAELSGKTLDGKFVRRYVDTDGVLVEEYDFGSNLGEQGQDGTLVRWNPNRPADMVKHSGNAIARRDANNKLVRYGEAIDYDATNQGKQRAQISGKEPNQIEDGRDKETIPLKENLPTREDQEEKFERKTTRVVIADITAIVDRYAKTLAERKVSERLNNSGFIKKSWVRLSEAGYVEKYYQEAKDEILKNRNLLSDIQTRLLHKSEGKTLHADSEDVHNEILENIIEAFQKDLLDQGTRNQEVKAEHVDMGAWQNVRLDVAAADLIVDFALGNITDQKTFDTQVEQKLVPILSGAGAKQGEGRMYASSLFEMAQGYKKEIQEKLGVVGKEFGPEQKAYVEKFIRGTLHLDVKLGEKQADLYQKRPEGAMKFYEKYVDHVQNGSVLGWSAKKLLGDELGGKIGRVAGKVLANPILYAAVGNMTGRAAAKGLGVALGTGAGVATGIAFMPATLAILGTGVAAGLYLGARAAREKRRDIARREQEAVLGMREKETHEVWQAEKLIADLKALQTADRLLAEEEKKYVGLIQARLDLQSKEGVDLIGVSKQAGEQYGTKFVAEQQLRKALVDFWRAKGMQYGNTAPEQLAAYRRFQGEAERLILPHIDRVEKEKAEQIRKYRNKVAIVGGGVAMGAAVLGPLVGKTAKMGWDHAFGTNFADGKITYLEEAWHLAKAKAGFGHPEGVYGGVILGHQLSGTNIEFKLPPSLHPVDQGVDAHGNHLIGIADSHNNIIPGGDKIPVDGSGKVIGGGLDKLKTAGWNISEAPGVAGSGKGLAFTEAELKADGFGIHKRADWHHIHDAVAEIKKHIFNGKELQAHKQVVGGGNELWDVSKMLNNLSQNAEMAEQLDKLGLFGADTTGNVDTQLQALKEQMMAWHATGGKAEVAKHMVMRVIASEHDNRVTGLTKVFNFDSDGHLNLPKEYANAAYKEIALIDDSGQAHVLATEHIPGQEMLKVGSGGNAGMVELRPPEAHLVEEPWVFAGAKRETDKDVDKQRQKEKEEKIKKELALAEAERKKQEEAEKKKEADKKKKGDIVNLAGAERSPEGKENLQVAFAELQPKLDKNELAEQDILTAAEKHKVTPLELVTMALDHKKVDYKKDEDEVMKAAQAGGHKVGVLDARWIILKMEQAKATGKTNTTEASEPKAEIVESADVIDDGPDDEEKVRTTIFAPPVKKKVVPISTTEKGTSTPVKSKAGEAGKGKPVAGEKSADIAKTRAEQRVKSNTELVRNFGRDYDIQKFKINVSDIYKDRFNERPIAENKVFLENLATALRRVTGKLGENIPKNINLSLGGTKLGLHPNRANTFVIPVTETPENISKYLISQLQKAPARSKPGEAVPRPVRKAA